MQLITTLDDLIDCVNKEWDVYITNGDYSPSLLDRGFLLQAPIASLWKEIKNNRLLVDPPL